MAVLFRFRGVLNLVRRHPLLTAAAVGLLLRVAYVLATLHFIPHSDNQSYLDRAMYLYQHHALMPNVKGTRVEPDAYWPPGFPAAMAILLELNSIAHPLGDIPFIRLGFSVFGLISIPALAFIARELFGPREGLIAAWLAALFPPAIYVGASMYSESMFVPIALCAIAAMLAYRRDGRRRWLVIAGLLTGVSALTHSEGLALALPLCWAAWKGPASKAGQNLAVLVAAILVVVAPWTIRNAVKFHAFVPVSTSLGNTLAGTYNPSSAAVDAHWLKPQSLPEYAGLFKAHPLTDPTQDSALTHAALSYVSKHPFYVVTAGFWNTVRILELQGSQFSANLEGIPVWGNWLGNLAFWALALVAIAGVPALRRTPGWVWLTPLLMYLAVVFLNTETPRFRAPIDPFLMLAATPVLARAASKMPATRLKQR
ncbi:MAG: glycosyltransferase family 39 protein [Solirubrobacterales bacterium]|nr:glycosyltransferase family 39 protein [Solirubrobacterales bacterium]